MKKVKSRFISDKKRLGSGFLAFAMTLGLLPTSGIQAIAFESEQLLQATTLTAEFGDDLQPASVATLPDTLPETLVGTLEETVEETETLPQDGPATLPPIEGLWEDDDSVLVEPSYSHWAEPYLNGMVEYGYMRSEMASDPDELLSRAEFMAVINRAYNYTDVGGENVFTDVLETDWFYDDVSIATTAGFISGTSDTTAEPLANLTRETTAYILGKNMMLPETSGENMVFTDANDISDWSRGMVKSTSHYGLMTGYEDGSFLPNNYITRGEIAALVLQAIGTPVQVAGEVEMGEVWGNLTITEPGTVLKNTIIAGDLYISNGIGLGAVTLENVTVLGRIVVSGGESNQGDASIVLRNVVSSQLIIDNLDNQMVTVRIEGNSYIENTYVRTNAYIEDNTTINDGLRTITIDAEPGTTIDFAGRVKEVFNTSPNTSVRVVDGSVEVMNIDESATEVMTEVLLGAEIVDLNIDVSTNVTGAGDVANATVNAEDVVIEMLPDNVTIRPGVNANINGQDMDSTTAEEFSSEPRILSGYPIASDVAPSSVLGVFATNKPGTIYWAISNITQGSVPEDQLLSPPTYGGVAIKSGNFDVLEAETEATAYIDELEIGGSYYLTAVLVDSRGDVSPIKVVAFSTPDNSIPMFAEGYPYMSLVTHNSAQVTVMATKSCKLYYAVLPAGSISPTPEDFLAGAVSGNEGSGVQDLQKNKDESFIVSTSLMELKDYVLYLWLTDADGMNYSEVVFLDFTTKDGTPPEFNQTPEAVVIAETSVDFNTSINEDGIIYWIAVVSGTVYPKVSPNDTSGALTEPWWTDYAKLQVAQGMNGGIGAVAGNMDVKGDETATFKLAGLDKETAYDLYYVAKDTAGNYSNSIGMVSFNTLDNTPPVFVEQTFSHVASSNGGEGVIDQPYATTSITLTFSEGIKSTYFEGTTGMSFLQLYTAVQSAGTSEAKTAAQNNLAAALANSIKLFTWNGNTPTEVVERNADNQYETDIQAGDWTIDYRYAVISLYEGQMRITFPTVEGADGLRSESALNLQAGVTYGFELKNIQDSSYDGNIMVPAEMKLDRFTTIYAEVMFGPASVMQSLPYKRAENGEPTDVYATLDEDLRITPSSMTNVHEDVVYEIRMNPNTNVSYNLYYRIVDEKGNHQDYFYNYDDPYDQKYYPNFPNTSYMNPANDGFDRFDRLKNSWEPDDNGWIMLSMDNVAANWNPKYETAPSTIQGNGEGIGIGLHYGFFGYQGLTVYPSLCDLGEEYQIEMMFEVTSFQGSTTRGEWNGTLNIDTQMFAGSYSYIRGLGAHGSVQDSVYNNVSLVSTPSDYVVSVNFTDSIPPDMGPGAPQVETEDITATLQVSFDGTRTGTLYYAIVEGVSPANLGPKDQDGNNVQAESIPDINKVLYDSLVTNDEDWPLIPVPILTSPIYLGVTTYVDPDNPSLYGNTWLDKTRVNIELTGLEPLTTYYVYLVTISDNGGGFSDPLLYQFTTTETERPKYPTLEVKVETGDVEVTTHVDSIMDYMMITRSTLNDPQFAFLSENFYDVLHEIPNNYSYVPNLDADPAGNIYYTFEEVYRMSTYWKNNDIYCTEFIVDPNDPTNTVENPDYVADSKYTPFTVFDLLAKEYTLESGNYNHPEYSPGYRVFDVFATNTMKTEVYTLIRTYTTQVSAVAKDVSTEEMVAHLVERNKTSGDDPDMEYVLFVTARNVNADNVLNGPDYNNTFVVVDNISVTDLVGPKLQTIVTYNASIENDGSDNTPVTYTGKVTMSFDKYLYAAQGSNRYFLQVADELPDESSSWFGMQSKELDNLYSKVYGVEVSKDSVDYNIPAKGFTFDFTDIVSGTSFQLLNNQFFLSNKNAVQHDGEFNNLIVTFYAEPYSVKGTVASDGSYSLTTGTNIWWETNWDDDDKVVPGIVDLGSKTETIFPDNTNLTDLYPLVITITEGQTLKRPFEYAPSNATFELASMSDSDANYAKEYEDDYVTIALTGNNEFTITAYPLDGEASHEKELSVAVLNNNTVVGTIKVTVVPETRPDTIEFTGGLESIEMVRNLDGTASGNLSVRLGRTTDLSPVGENTVTWSASGTGITLSTTSTKVNGETGHMNTFSATNIGTNVVTATVTDAKGLTIKTEIKIEVVDAPSTPLSITTGLANKTVDIGEELDMSIAYTGGSYPWTVTWEVDPTTGAGLTSVDKSATFKASAAGTYTLTATVTDGRGTSVDTSCTITVNPDFAIDKVTGDISTTVGAEETLEVTTIGEKGAVTYKWEVTSTHTAGDYVLTDATTSEAKFKATKAGTYEITVTVEDSDGKTDSETFEIEVEAVVLTLEDTSGTDVSDESITSDVDDGALVYKIIVDPSVEVQLSQSVDDTNYTTYLSVSITNDPTLGDILTVTPLNTGPYGPATITVTDAISGAKVTIEITMTNVNSRSISVEKITNGASVHSSNSSEYDYELDFGSTNKADFKISTEDGSKSFTITGNDFISYTTQKSTSSEDPFIRVNFTANGKGSTVLTITDNETKQSVDILVEIT